MDPTIQHDDGKAWELMVPHGTGAIAAWYIRTTEKVGSSGRHFLLTATDLGFENEDADAKVQISINPLSASIDPTIDMQTQERVIKGKCMATLVFGQVDPKAADWVRVLRYLADTACLGTPMMHKGVWVNLLATATQECSSPPPADLEEQDEIEESDPSEKEESWG